MVQHAERGLGDEVRVTLVNGVVLNGFLQDIGHDGALILLMEANERRRVPAAAIRTVERYRLGSRGNQVRTNLLIWLTLEVTLLISFGIYATSLTP